MGESHDLWWLEWNVTEKISLGQALLADMSIYHIVILTLILDDPAESMVFHKHFLFSFGLIPVFG